MDENDMFYNLAQLQKLLKGSTDSQSIAMLNNVMTETLSMSMHNAITTQHNAQLVNTAATTSTCARILSAFAKPQPPLQPVVVSDPPMPLAPMLPVVANPQTPSGHHNHPS